MVSGSIKIGTLATGLALVLLTELLGWGLVRISVLPPMSVGALIRIAQVIIIVWVVIQREEGLAAIGWAPADWLAGLKTGAIWSLAFAAAAGAGMAVVYLNGTNPLHLIKSPLPDTGRGIFLFFLVGGVIAPVAEELVFRGLLYRYFRRWGVICALAASTIIFVSLHSTHGIPYTQIIGGTAFAIAYETSDNLMVPITIHCSGNLAIFSLSLL